MKFLVHMKCPDALDEAIEARLRPTNLDIYEREEEKEKIQAICARWFNYGEVVTVEIDTEKETCNVVPIKN